MPIGQQFQQFGQTLQQGLGGVGDAIEDLTNIANLSKNKEAIKAEISSKMGKTWSPSIIQTVNRQIDNIKSIDELMEKGYSIAQQINDWENSPGGLAPQWGIQYETWKDDNSKIKGMKSAQGALSEGQSRQEYLGGLRSQLGSATSPQEFGAAATTGGQLAETFPQEQQGMTPYQQQSLNLRQQELERKQKIDAATQRHRERQDAKAAGREVKSDINVMMDDLGSITSKLGDLQAKIRQLTTRSPNNPQPMSKEMLVDEFMQEAYLKGIQSALFADIVSEGKKMGRMGAANMPAKLERDFSLEGGGEGPLMEGDVRFKEPAAKGAQAGSPISPQQEQMAISELQKNPRLWQIYQSADEQTKQQIIRKVLTR